MLKLIGGRRLIRRAPDRRILLSAQHARPGHIAQSAVLSKVLSYDLIQLTRLTAASMDNDAAGCYNKIVPPHGMLCCRRLGLPKSAAKMLATILHNTVFYLRTGHSISARTYCSNSICVLTASVSSCFPSLFVHATYINAVSSTYASPTLYTSRPDGLCR